MSSFVLQLLHADETDVLLSNTAAEEEMFRYAVPRGLLDGWHGIRVTIRGTVKDHSGSHTNTLTWRVKYGSTTMFQDTSGLFGSTSSSAPFLLGLNLMAKGSWTQQELDGEYTQGSRNTPAAGQGQISGSSIPIALIYGESAEDAMDDHDLVVTVQWSSAHANTWTMRRKSTVEHL